MQAALVLIANWFDVHLCPIVGRVEGPPSRKKRGKGGATPFWESIREWGTPQIGNSLETWSLYFSSIRFFRSSMSAGRQFPPSGLTCFPLDFLNLIAMTFLYARHCDDEVFLQEHFCNSGTRSQRNQ